MLNGCKFLLKMERSLRPLEAAHLRTLVRACGVSELIKDGKIVVVDFRSNRLHFFLNRNREVKHDISQASIKKGCLTYH